jgi:hypothetical protein
MPNASEFFFHFEFRHIILLFEQIIALINLTHSSRNIAYYLEKNIIK